MKLLFLLSFIIDMLFVTPSYAESGPTVPPDYSVEGLDLLKPNGRKHGGSGRDHLTIMKAQLPIKPANYAITNRRGLYGF